MKKLKKQFYMQDTLCAAKELLGKYLVHNTSNGRIVGKIVEVEAYIGPNDKGSHSYGGKRTARNETMYAVGGTAYVYIIYGMYYCMNVVTSKIDKPEAVLIRAVEPVEGCDIMAQNRFEKSFNELTKKQVYNLTSGPGKLCIAMGINKEENGENLCGNKLFITQSSSEKFEIVEAKRIGIDYAEEAKDYLWRFYIKDNKYISKK
jgi:DNA-3-methyladenine glycosylase